MWRGGVSRSFLRSLSHLPPNMLDVQQHKDLTSAPIPTPVYLLESVLSDNDEFSKIPTSDFRELQDLAVVLCSAVKRVHQAGANRADPPRSARIIAQEVFAAVTPKGKQIQRFHPFRTWHLFAWTVDTTARSYITVRISTHAIHVLLNTTFTAIARTICMRPGNSRGVKSKSYSRPRDLSRHIILGTTSPGDVIMKNSYGLYRSKPPSHPVQTKQKIGRVAEQMQ